MDTESNDLPEFLTQEAALQQMEYVQQSGPGMGISIFIVVKSLFVIFSNIAAITAWNKSALPMRRPVQALLCFSSVMVVSTVYYKFRYIHKDIGPLFLLQGLSCYTAFCVFHVLIGYVKNESSRVSREALLKKFRIFHVMYWSTLFIGYKISDCSKKDFYPNSFVMTCALFVSLFVFIHNLKRKGFNLKWAKDEQKSKELFEAQIDRYYNVYRFLVIMHVFQICLAKSLDRWANAMQCSDDGLSWIYTTKKGNFFIMLHMIIAGVTNGLPANVFVKTVKKLGLKSDGPTDDSAEPSDAAATDSKKVN